MRGLPIAILAMTATLIVGPAGAQSIATNPGGAISGMGSGFALQAHVPVLCVTDFTPNLAGAGQMVELGELATRCNALHGYQLYVDYPVGLTGVDLLVDGRVVPLDGGGRTLLLDANGPEIRKIHVQARVAPGGAAPAVGVFRFEDGAPKG